MMRLALVVFFGLAAVPVLGDVTVYRSTDAKGTVSYSDKPPADAASLPITIEASDPVPSPEVDQRREAMRTVTEQMQADRLAREQARADAAALAEPAAPPGDYEDPVDDVPLYYPYRPHRSNRPYPPRGPGYAPRPPAVPRPNPNSASPQGLLEKIRQQY